MVVDDTITDDLHAGSYIVDNPVCTEENAFIGWCVDVDVGVDASLE